VDHEGEREANHRWGIESRDGIKSRVESLPWEEPGGSLLTGQVVPGVKVARA
jgi:hypothetical protein